MKYPNLPTTNDWFWGGGVNDQMQIVNTKLPRENIQTYQPQMINSGGRGAVNDQMQIVNKLPNGNIQTYQPQMIDSGVGGCWGWVNDQMEIVNTKLPNEIFKPTNHKWSILGGG